MANLVYIMKIYRFRFQPDHPLVAFFLIRISLGKSFIIQKGQSANVGYNHHNAPLLLTRLVRFLPIISGNRL